MTIRLVSIVLLSVVYWLVALLLMAMAAMAPCGLAPESWCDDPGPPLTGRILAALGSNGVLFLAGVVYLALMWAAAIWLKHEKKKAR
ncbi:hypothetical protein PQ455_01290 [Sphingomonas naphthae]|uniref:DUF1467 family protein n=1 Tax=Sphingomonas naphthae TaxID=1813468 RepID=A0ABY7TL14_9SPHN|nr:hypothetical protein [Sphingomonas naphthae]WCT73895.1 hypothetical protein PQ455_01290 [Sphingomonas naphthae]